MTSLDQLRQKVASALTAAAVAVVPVLFVVAWAFERSPIQTLGIATLLAGMPALLIALKRPVTIVSYAVTLALVGETSLLVLLLTGHSWQIEMHFYYFVVLALVACFCDWVVIVFAASLIAAEHLVLNFVLPSAIFPGGTNTWRVIVHAVAVVFEAGMLVGIARAIRLAFRHAETAQ